MAENLLRSLSCLAAVALLATGCGTLQLAGPSPESQAPPSAAPPPPVKPPVEMAGRWTLSSGPKKCAMNLGATPGAPEGTVAPEGGCPGNFYTSRKWVYDHTGLSIRNHRGEPLAQLTMADGRFSGQSVTGEPVTLGR
jgi:protease inhibitor Inh